MVMPVVLLEQCLKLADPLRWQVHQVEMIQIAIIVISFSMIPCLPDRHQMRMYTVAAELQECQVRPEHREHLLTMPRECRQKGSTFFRH